MFRGTLFAMLEELAHEQPEYSISWMLGERPPTSSDSFECLTIAMTRFRDASGDSGSPEGRAGMLSGCGGSPTARKTGGGLKEG